jgi:hypothetical protein
MESFRQFALIAALFLQLLPASAADAITNFMSPIVSYQYSEDFSSQALTNGGVISPFVSYQYLEDFSGEALTNGGISSPIISYQYFEWPGDSILSLQSSPMVSYFYLNWGAPPDTLSSSSVVTVSPSSVPADGHSPVTVTVRLQDANGAPVPGKTMTVSAVEVSLGLVTPLSTITQPTEPTDANGQATATLTSATPGMAIISVQDVTDGVSLQQRTVGFSSPPVMPNNDLAVAIVMLYRTSAENLTGSSLSISSVCLDAGSRGDEFRAQFSEDKAVGALDAIYGFATSLVGAGDYVEEAKLADLPGVEKLGSIPASGLGEYLFNDRLLQAANLPSVFKSVFWDLLQNVLVAAQSATLDELVSAGFKVVGSEPDGLSQRALSVAQRCAAYQQALAPQSQALVTQGIPPLRAEQQSAWASDMESRYGYSTAMVAILAHEDAFLQQFATARQQSDQGAFKLAASKFAFEAGASALYKPAGIVAGLLDTTLGERATMQQMDFDQQGYDIAYSIVEGGLQYAEQVYFNAANAYTEINLGMPASPVTANIGTMTDVEESYQIGLPGVLTIYSSVTKAYSLLNIANTSSGDARFEVVVLSGYSGPALGKSIPNLPQTTMGTLTIPVNSSAQVTINYLNGGQGGKPDPSTPMSVYVLGLNGSGVFYIGGFNHNWNPNGGASGGVKPNDAQPEIENPLNSYVTQNSTNQTYAAQIFVVNPFDQPYSAIVTQALPPGFSVLSTDGAVFGSAIVWTNATPAGGVAIDSFTFAAALVPGAQTNLPAATLIFVDPTNNMSSVISSASPGVGGLPPVQASASVPNGMTGTDVPMMVAITNWTTANQAGSLTIVLTNSAGVQAWTSSVPFAVSGSAGTNIAFVLPGTLQAGPYSLVGALNINGGTAQFVSGTYVVPLPPTMLSLDSTALTTTNSFTMVLRGPTGFGFLVEASTNLLDWVPIQYFVSTNPAVYVTAPMTADYQTRFYRAVAVAP